MRDAHQLTDFIKQTISIKEFYLHITLNGTNFNFDINLPDSRNFSAFHCACREGNVELVQALINMGANVNQQIKNGHTALFLAIENRHLNVVKVLCENGFNMNDLFGVSKSPHSNLYIECAISIGGPEIASYLITYASKNLQQLIAYKLRYDPNFFNQSTKNVKVDFLNQDCLALITEASPRYSITNSTKNDKIRDDIVSAVRTNDLTLLDSLLSDYGFYIDIRQFTLQNRSLTQVAAVVHGNIEMVKLLIKYGGFVTGANCNSNTTISSEARKAGHTDIADFLDNVQKVRYESLLNDAILQKKRQLLAAGIFFDSCSQCNSKITPSFKY